MDHFRPHTKPLPTFEGYYSKFTLPSTAELVLVICSVPKATSKPHMVSFTYVPPGFPDVEYFQRELWVEDVEMVGLMGSGVEGKGKSNAVFELRIPSVGFMRVYEDHATEYSIIDRGGDFSFEAYVPGGTHNRVSWRAGVEHSTPEGWLINLPLPLHWHVHTLASKCAFDLYIKPDVFGHVHPKDRINDGDSNGNRHDDSLILHPATDLVNTSFLHNPANLTATMHQEKNWAYSFPTSHIWLKAHNPRSQTSLCLAGGSIIGMQAYLITYHAQNPSHSVSFTPPAAMTPSFLPSLSPTLKVNHSWPDRRVEISVSSLTTRIEIVATAPEGTFIGLSAPFHDGHRENFLAQSYRARIRVKVWRASWAGLGHWSVVCEEVFERGAMEFGADAYGAVGSESRVH